MASKTILNLMKDNPFCYPPAYEKLCGDLSGLYSKSINRQHRIVYEVVEELKEIHVIRMWTHYRKERKRKTEEIIEFICHNLYS